MAPAQPIKTPDHHILIRKRKETDNTWRTAQKPNMNGCTEGNGKTQAKIRFILRVSGIKREIRSTPTCAISDWTKREVSGRRPQQRANRTRANLPYEKNAFHHRMKKS